MTKKTTTTVSGGQETSKGLWILLMRPGTASKLIPAISDRIYPLKGGVSEHPTLFMELQYGKWLSQANPLC